MALLPGNLVFPSVLQKLNLGLVSIIWTGLIIPRIFFLFLLLTQPFDEDYFLRFSLSWGMGFGFSYFLPSGLHTPLLHGFPWALGVPLVTWLPQGYVS